MAKRAPRTGNPRTQVIGFRAPPEQRQRIEDAAIAAGMTLSAFVASTVEAAMDGRRRGPTVPVNSARGEIAAGPTAVNSQSQPATRQAPAPSVASAPMPPNPVAVNSQSWTHQAPPYAAPPAYPPINVTAVSSAHPPLLVPPRAPVAPPTQRPSADVDRGAAPPQPFSQRGPFMPDFPVPVQRQPRERPASPPLLPTVEHATLNELKRIGNNINQLAHASNSGLPPSVEGTVAAFKSLFDVLTDGEEFKRRLHGLKAKAQFHGSANPQARDELQGSNPVRPARPR